MVSSVWAAVFAIGGSAVSVVVALLLGAKCGRLDEGDLPNMIGLELMATELLHARTAYSVGSFGSPLNRKST